MLGITGVPRRSFSETNWRDGIRAPQPHLLGKLYFGPAQNARCASVPSIPGSDTEEQGVPRRELPKALQTQSDPALQPPFQAKLLIRKRQNTEPKNEGNSIANGAKLMVEEFPC